MSSKKIVIAEDEPLIRLDLRESLTESGYEVVGEAGDGQQAIEMVRDLRPDVAILDIKMPRVDGLAAAAEIVRERMAAVVILTAFSQRDLVDQATQAGAMAYLVKPYQPSELVPAIELAAARFRELVALSDQTESLTEQAEALSNQAESLSDQLETRKLVDRAKGLLMDSHAMAEQDAFRFLQTTAMSQRLQMKDVAEQVLAGSLTP